VETSRATPVVLRALVNAIGDGNNDPLWGSEVDRMDVQGDLFLKHEASRGRQPERPVNLGTGWERMVDRVSAFHGLVGNRWSWPAIALSLVLQLLVRRVTPPRRMPEA
jgi:hypothetical protein